MSAEFQDQTITCVDCGQQFTWSAGEQEFYRQKGFSSPKRCKACKQAKKAERGGESGATRIGERH